MDKKAQKQPAHVGFATIAITLMAVGLAAGLEILGMIGLIDRWIATSLLKPGFSAPVHALNPYTLWTATALLALGLTAVMLNVSSNWRRLLIWVLAFAITSFWAPVLLLASHKPEIGLALVGLFWSGCCAIVYSMNHDLPADLTESNHTTKDDATS